MIDYRNDFLFFTLSRLPDGGVLYCSGVNITRFLPITRGRHRPMSNPAMRGLQLVNLDVRSIALAEGANLSGVTGLRCTGKDHAGGNWFTEALRIDNSSEKLPGAIIDHCAVEFPKKLLKAILLSDETPDKPVPPDELQDILKKLCANYG